VKVWVEDANTGDVRHTASAYLTFAALDDTGNPIAVAPVIPENDEEKRRYEEAGARRERRLLARQNATSSTQQEGWNRTD
jgi:acyl-CoA hydrolase